MRYERLGDSMYLTASVAWWLAIGILISMVTGDSFAIFMTVLGMIPFLFLFGYFFRGWQR